MNNCRSIFIIAPPDRWRESLVVLLQADAQVTIAGQVDDVATGLEWAAEHITSTVLLDADLPDERMWRMLEQLKITDPKVRCIVLAHNSEQAQRACEAGVQVLSSGFSAETLFQVLADFEK